MPRSLLHIDPAGPSEKLYNFCKLHAWTYHHVENTVELLNLDLKASLILTEAYVPDFKNSKTTTYCEEIMMLERTKHYKTGPVILYTNNQKAIEEADLPTIKKYEDLLLNKYFLDIFTGANSGRMN